ncbi:alpha/beta hydrolase [Burkholderia sp. WAC0059]|uniref:alpha/beta hydrolase n=1 Tax=Burkholderia sp. WAC0059 TaxID=2066022 RepID=UPI000C7F59D1|nr:alpha/beta fold hydrolase [Burkholderia sp. WAC0059]PLZ04012.1 alpha/beta hydrolase [Burkholderia sp. WAC0059]
MDYSSQQAWRDIEACLPREFRLDGQGAPREDWWPWRGHRIHLDRFANPDAPAKVILFHGVGTNGREMSTVLGAPLFRSGLETVAVDMPGYGVTQVAPGNPATYDDWVRIASDFIDAELARDPRPIVLYGLSAGGMLTYHAAALNRRVKGIIGMTFLDQRERQVNDETSINLPMSRLGAPLMHLIAKTPLAGMRVPMRLAAKMNALVNDRAALRACLKDRTSAGAWVSVRFLSSYLRYRPAIEPEQFDVCPILLTQPEKDRWTPLHLSKIFLDRIGRVPKTVVMLGNAGHYPLEQPGLAQLHDAALAFVLSCCGHADRRVAVEAAS